MCLVEIAGDPLDRRMVQLGSFVPECKYDPVHSYFDRKIDSDSEAFPYARKNGGVLPVVIASVDHYDAAWIQPRMAIAVKFRRAELGESSEDHTSELKSLMRISHAVFCLHKK